MKIRKIICGIFLFGLLSIISGCFSAQCTPLRKAAAKSAASPMRINITAAPYYAQGNGAADNTAAINHALADAAAATPKRSVYAPLGTFAHSGVLHVGGVILSGAGPKTIFQAIDPAEGAIELTGMGGGIQNCTLLSPFAKTRLSSSHSAAISVTGAAKFTITKVCIGDGNIPGAASAGILCADHASFQGTIANNRVSNTLADGIHLTAGAKHITVRENILLDTGDDMIAVVSYRKDGAVVSQIRITQNRCIRQTNGRGISVVGGDGVMIDHNVIQSSDVAGIYLASEDSYDTFAPTNVQVIGNTIRNANQKHAVTHGGIYLFGRMAHENERAVPYLARNITIQGNTLSNTYYMGIRVGGYARDVRILNNHVTGTTAEGIAVSDTGDPTPGAGAQDIVVSGNTVQATAWGAIKIFPSAQGALTITDNRLSNIGTSNNPGVDVIGFDVRATGIHSLRLTGNQYDRLGGHPVHSYINCPLSAAAAGTSGDAIQRGNTTTIVPPKPILVLP